MSMSCRNTNEHVYKELTLPMRAWQMAIGHLYAHIHAGDNHVKFGREHSASVYQQHGAQ